MSEKHSKQAAARVPAKISAQGLADRYPGTTVSFWRRRIKTLAAEGLISRPVGTRMYFGYWEDIDQWLAPKPRNA